MSIMETNETDRSSLIAEMNDRLRATGRGGFIVLTSGVKILDDETVERIIKAVRAFSDFTPDNDPHREHDFGVVYVDRHIVFWKIDYYDPSLTQGSDDPASEESTCRVLTVMFREEY